MNYVGIDVYTISLKYIIRRLRGLKSTLNVIDGGLYHYNPVCSQIWLKTTKTCEQVENWFYNCKDEEFHNFIGTFEVSADIREVL